MKKFRHPTGKMNLWRGIDYKVYLKYKKEGVMEPKRQKYHASEKRLYFATNWKISASYAIVKEEPCILEFNKLDLDLYELVRDGETYFNRDAINYFYTTKPISIKEITYVYTLKKDKEVRELFEDRYKRDLLIRPRSVEKYWNKKKYR